MQPLDDTSFDAPLLFSHGDPEPVDLSKTPYFFNDNGHPRYVAALPRDGKLLRPAKTNPKIALGKEYAVSVAGNSKPMPGGVATRLEFKVAQVVYKPLQATREAAAAFGMTLVEKGQGVRIARVEKGQGVRSACVEEGQDVRSAHGAPLLAKIQYVYGAFAGHWSPYHDTGRKMLPVVTTDLECHDFPHVFASVDPHLPLVISVARYFPKKRKIHLADLWVPIGSALYVPAQPFQDDAECLDLHGNRNSARACWGTIARNSIETHTLLHPDDQSFRWFWNDRPTVHANLEPR